MISFLHQRTGSKILGVRPNKLQCLLYMLFAPGVQFFSQICLISIETFKAGAAPLSPTPIVFLDITDTPIVVAYQIARL